MARYYISQRGVKHINLGAFLEAKHAAPAWDAEAWKQKRPNEYLKFPEEMPSADGIKRLCVDSTQYSFMGLGRANTSQSRGVTVDMLRQSRFMFK